MSLKSLMEDKQLNFDQPLLSVRRFSSAVASTEAESKRKNGNSFFNLPPLPIYKSELKSGPVRNPGAVPFVWEQTPGRPKDESKPQTQGTEKPPIAPKLPPGRILNVKQQPSDYISKVPTVAAAQTGNFPSNSQGVSSLDENVADLVNSNEGVEDKESSGSEYDDVAYLDALDSLSRSESFFFNCSLSGLSGLDSSDVKPSRTFSTDPQTRDFMMGRFLPAAKAMASETPQYSSRRQPIPPVQPRQVKHVASGDETHPPYQYRQNVSSHSDQDKISVSSDRLDISSHFDQYKVSEDSEDEDDHDETEILSAKVCGLFPRFCLRNSFCLLNPVPGMRVQARLPSSSIGAARARPSNGYTSRTTVNKHSRNAVCDKRSGGPQTSIEDTKGAVNKGEVKTESSQITYKSDSQKPDGSSLYLRLQGGGMSPYQSDSLLSHLHEEKEFLGTPEEAIRIGVNGSCSPKQGGHKIFRELLAWKSPDRESGLESPTVEKTLYIDSVQMVETRNSNSIFSDMKGLNDSRRSDFEIPGNSGSPSMESPIEDTKHSNIADEEGMSQLKSMDSIDSNLLFSSDKPDQEIQMEKQPNLILDSIILNGREVLNNENLDDENQQPSEADSLEKYHDSHSEFPLPPPLPKSPSESWLLRTLPSISSRNPNTRSHLITRTNPRNQVSKTSSTDPKWETIVKTSNMHQRHLQFSEKQLPVPEAQTCKSHF